MIKSLRSASEEGVQAALAGSYAEQGLGPIEPAAKLDLWRL